MENISVYLHIPFCQRKCFYCAFNSFPWQEELAEKIVLALKEEIRLWGKELSPFLFQVPTLFLGGGTPTCLSSCQLEEILEACHLALPLTSQAEITVEANPGTVDREKLKILQDSGVNRLSFGVQSLDNRFLAFLGRIHTREQFLANYYLARELGFSNINLDFIFALPGQTLPHWQATLKEAVALEPEHLSTYNLVLEEGTPLYQGFNQGEFTMVEEEQDLAMYEESINFLNSQGFNHYEISNFAKPGQECRHNLVYWRNEAYLGLGPGAHSYWQQDRFFNYPSLPQYMDCLKRGEKPIAEREKITLPLAMGETMMQGLRLKEGVSFNRFQQRFGFSLAEIYSEQLTKLTKLGLLAVEKDRIVLTERGLYLANSVFQEFL